MFWGKWTRGFYPLEAHLIDTAAFACALCERWVPEPVVRRAATLLGTDPAGVVDLVVAAAGLHDVGKATAVFQRQLLSAHPPMGLDVHGAKLEAAGLAVPPRMACRPTNDTERRWVRRHEIAGAVVLHRDGSDAGATGIASLVAGHHGVWDIPFESCPYHQWMLSNQAWSAARTALIDRVVAATGLQPDLRVADASTVPLLTGIVVLADWLASDLVDDDRTLPHGPDWPAHHARRLEDAAAAVDGLLGTVARPSATFDEVFGFAPSRNVQQELVRRGDAGLRIVAVPTGTGKTEAALGHWLHNAVDRQGLFFALPTMATADAMFTRVRSMFAGVHTTGALVHGRAILNQFYDPPGRPLDPESDDGVGGLTPARWLSGNRRALLAPVAVGTADQVLLAALAGRHNFLRLLGTACKTVVLDEVHSYDPYMARLLCQFLRWAGHWHLDVVLLSASLPRQQLADYVAAYGGDPEAAAAVYPAITQVTADGLTHQTPVDHDGDERDLRLVYHHADDPAATTVTLVRRLRADHPTAKIGVIVNTVRRCQTIGAALAGHAVLDETPQRAVEGQLQVMHARFTADRRREQVDEAVATYGKASTTEPAIMVATQVVEQSVDLDFDVLVTDLCPAPSLVQRAGRLHRHDLTDPRRMTPRERPLELHEPTVHVIVPAGIDAATVRQGPLLPYPAGSMVRTWRTGLDTGHRSQLAVPADIQTFVDRSHLDLVDLADPDGIDIEVEEELQDRIVQVVTADRLTIPDPDDLRDDPARSLPAHSPHGVEQRPQTRWIDRASFDLLLVNGGPGTWHGDLPDRPKLSQLRDLLGHVVSVPFDPDPATATMLDRAPSRDGWAGTPLEDVRVLDLSADTAHRLDPLLGLTTDRTVNG